MASKKWSMPAAWLLVSLWFFGCATFQEGEARIPIKGLKFQTVDGWKLHVETMGDEGETLLFLHGYSSTLAEWNAVAPGLCRHHRCILVDLPGFGWSDKFEGDYSPEALAEKLSRLLEIMNVQSAHVIAHSWGASIALALAHAHPEQVDRLVLVGGWVFYDQLPTVMLWSRVPVVGEFIYTVFFDEQPEMKYEQIYYEPNKHVSEQEVEYMRIFLDWEGVKRAALQAARDQRLEDTEKIYPEVAQRSLLIWGEEDQVSYPFYGKRLHAELPDSKLVMFPRCGHVPHLEAPDLFVTTVLGFLRSSRSVAGEVTP